MVSSLTLAMCIFSLAIFLESCYAQNSPQDFLAAHNAARAEVGVGPLKWDDSLAAYARDYANKFRGNCNIVHSHGPYGENIAVGGNDFSAAEAVSMWVKEKSEYDYKSNKCIGKHPAGCLHYTQVVWSASKRLGCAKVPCDDRGSLVKSIIICNYDPPGNQPGQRPYQKLAISI